MTSPVDDGADERASLRQAFHVTHPRRSHLRPATSPPACLAHQGGVMSRAQAREAGWTAARIARRIRRGDRQELHDGRVLTVAGTALSREALAWAAVLAIGRSVLAGPSAAAIHGIHVPWPTPCVLAPTTSRREPPGITVFRDTLADDDLFLRDGLLLTGRARTVADCLLLLPESAGRSFLDRALQLRWTTLDDLQFRAVLMTCRPGVAMLRRQIAVARGGTRSEGERLLVRLLRRAGISGWVTNYELSTEGMVAILDVAFVGLRLALEVDGRAWHSASDRFQRDRTRQNALVASGWTVLRFTWEDLTERPETVLATVRGSLSRLPAA